MSREHHEPGPKLPASPRILSVSTSENNTLAGIPGRNQAVWEGKDAHLLDGMIDIRPFPAIGAPEKREDIEQDEGGQATDEQQRVHDVTILVR